MPVPFAAIASVAAPVVAGLFGKKGQKDANKANREEAQRNRDFQREMSSTSWQRGVKDMEMAGLNPALAYGEGGASSPSGSVAAKQESEALPGISSAIQMAAHRKQMQLIDDQALAHRMSAQASSATAERTRAETSVMYGGPRRPGGAREGGYYQQIQDAYIRVQNALGEQHELALPYLRNSARAENLIGGPAAYIDRALKTGTPIAGGLAGAAAYRAMGRRFMMRGRNPPPRDRTISRLPIGN